MEWAYFSTDIGPDDTVFDLTCTTKAGQEPIFEIYGAPESEGTHAKPNPMHFNFAVKLEGKSSKTVEIDVDGHSGSRLLLGVLNNGQNPGSVDLLVEPVSTDSDDEPEEYPTVFFVLI
jgi:hypothetical protein